MIFNKPLLIIIAGLVSLLLLTGWMLKKSVQKNGELSQITSQYERANIVLAESVQQAYKNIEIADQVSREAEESRKALERKFNEQKRKIKELRDTNETVNQYLNTVIPDELLDRLRHNKGDQ